MNTTNCPPYTATDEIFSLQYELQSCDMSTIVYPLLMSIVLTIRCLGWLASVRFWLKRRNLMLKTPHNGQRTNVKRRLPLVPTMSAIMQVFWLLFLVLTAADVATNKNGITSAFWGCLTLLWGTSSMSLVHRLIQLGGKLIPLSGATMDGTSTEFAKSLKRLDFALRICFLLMRVLLVLQFIFFCIINPASSTLADLALTGGFAVCAMFCAILACSLVWQLQRLIVATRRLSSEVTGAQQQQQHPGMSTLAKAIRAMRHQQLVWVITGGVASFIFSAWASRLFYAKWYSIFILACTETAALTFVACSQRGVSSSKAHNRQFMAVDVRVPVTSPTNNAVLKSRANIGPKSFADHVGAITNGDSATSGSSLEKTNTVSSYQHGGE